MSPFNTFPVAVQYLSDCHLEMPDAPWPNLTFGVAPYLALCGDIGNPFEETYIAFIISIAKHFERVFVVAGNHEFHGHGRPMAEVHSRIRNMLAEKVPNAIYMDMDAHKLAGGNLMVLGCTLWSMADDKLARVLNDYRHVTVTPDEVLTPAIVRKLHAQHESWLHQEISKAQEDGLSVLVLTHHAPTHLMNGTHYGSESMSGFSTDLAHLFRQPVVGWICGHTHQNVPGVRVNGIPCVSNCVGYHRTKAPHDMNATRHEPDKVLRVGTTCPFLL